MFLIENTQFENKQGSFSGHARADLTVAWWAGGWDVSRIPLPPEF